MGRWRWAVLAILPLPAACGWHPVYVSGSSRAASVAASLTRIDVAIIPERQGQLLRQALQARLAGAGSGESAGFVLQAGYSVNEEGVGIMPDSSITRLRLVATSSFVVRSLGSDLRTCLSGSARAVDGLDLENEQFFASDLETETAERRLANAVADQIVMKLALAFGRKGGSGCEAR